MQPHFKVSVVFFLFAMTFVSECHAGKIFGFGSKDYDIIFLGTPVSAHEMRDRDQIDAIENPSAFEEGRAVVVFKIDRVLVGEFPKVLRGGLGRFDQASEAAKNKDLLKIVGWDFKDPKDEIPRETLRIAVKNPMETFGIEIGKDLAYFQHKIYLKRVSKDKSTSYLFVKSRPVLKIK